MKGKRHIAMAGFVGFVCFMVWVVAIANAGGRNPLFDAFRRIPNYDKLGHFVLMGILAFLALGACWNKVSGSNWRRLALILGPVIVLIALEEGSQYFIETRTFSGWDFFFGLLGVLLFGLLGMRVFGGNSAKNLNADS